MKILYKITISILVILFLLFGIPMLINYGIMYGFAGEKLFYTEFNNEKWFEFWYTYLPAIIAFSGTIYAVLQANKQNQRLQDNENSNFAFSIMPEIQMSLREAKYEVLDIGKDFSDYEQDHINLVDVESKNIKESINNLIDDLEATQIKAYSNVIEELKKVVLDNEVNVSSNYFYNSNNFNIIQELNIKEQIDKINSQMSNLNSEKTKYRKFTLLNRVQKGNLDVLQSHSKRLILISEDALKVPRNSNEIFYFNYSFNLRNFSNTDIEKVRIKQVEIEIQDNEILIFPINKEVSSLIHQIRKGEKNENEDFTQIFIHLFNSKTRFDSDNDMTFKISYDITTSLGFKYICNNLISFSAFDKKYTKISYANSMPIKNKV